MELDVPCRSRRAWQIFEIEAEGYRARSCGVERVRANRRIGAAAASREPAVRVEDSQHNAVVSPDVTSNIDSLNAEIMQTGRGKRRYGDRYVHGEAAERRADRNRRPAV